MSQLSSPLGVLGKPSDPYSGRVWHREFPHGDYEILYKSGKGPSEVERINAWLAADGSENRVAHTSSLRVCADTGEIEEKPEFPSETNEERSARRAKQKLRWLIKCIGADRLLTLTFRENVTDYAQAEKALNAFLHKCRNEWGREFRFAVVPERQQRGAWHFHLALRGWWNINKLRGFWWRSLGAKIVWSAEGRPVMRDGGQTLGNVDIQGCRKGGPRRVWAVDRLAGYLAKYLSKTIGTEDLGGSPSYRGTRGLHPTIKRYVVKALTFRDVLAVFLACGADEARYVFQSEDRAVLWASGLTPDRPNPSAFEPS